jgi:hypothetical protein
MQNIDWTLLFHVILTALVIIGNFAQYLLSQQNKARQARLDTKTNVMFNIMTNGKNLEDELSARGYPAEVKTGRVIRLK